MKTTIKQTIQKLIESGKTLKEIKADPEMDGIKKTTIAWYFNKLKTKADEPK